MSERLDASLRAEMARWESRGLRRDVDAAGAMRGERRLEFTSNDYLSLADHPSVVAAARDAIERYGVGGRAARLLGGGCELDREAEKAAAEWLGAESALLFPSGYQANAGLLGALAERGDAIFSDELNHASIIDAARLSRAEIHVYRHRDVEQLDGQLARAQGARRRIVVTESVFSMDGDLAPLLQLHEVCTRRDAFLVIDEAHAAGLIGARGAGGWSAVDADGALGAAKSSCLAARIVTGGKALGVSGAFVVGSRALREHLANRARAFIFTTAVSPAVSAALCASISVARTSHDVASRVLAQAKQLAGSLGIAEPAAAIVPFVVGRSEDAVQLSRELAAGGIDVRAVRPPSVPEGTARLRIASHAHNDDEAFARLIARLRVAPRQHPITIEPKPSVRTLCVVGTDTDVGKTVVSALLARAALRRGRATYWKPVQTGDASDTAELSRLAGPDVVLAEPKHEFPLPASPHAAAEAAGARVDFEGLRRTFATLRAECNGLLIVELAGGLLVPYDDEHTQADLVALERPEVVLVARSGLGTLNHVHLTLEALAARGIAPVALFLVGTRHPSNAATLRRSSGIRNLFELERLEPLDTRHLDDWLARNDLRELFA